MPIAGLHWKVQKVTMKLLSHPKLYHDDVPSGHLCPWGSGFPVKKPFQDPPPTAHAKDMQQNTPVFGFCRLSAVFFKTAWLRQAFSTAESPRRLFSDAQVTVCAKPSSSQSSKGRPMPDS